MHVRSTEGEERVTPLELFFDLVFVFAITQVTGFLAENGVTPPGPRSGGAPGPRRPIRSGATSPGA